MLIGHMRSGSCTPRLLLAAAVGLSLLVLAIRIESYHRRGLMPDLVLDDAYISFRYARNLVEGHGLVFNPGERVEGYTNFLWTVLLAGTMAAGADPVSAAEILAALAAAGTMLLLALVARRLLRPPLAAPATFLPPLLFAALGSQARHVISGMETLLFVFLVFAGFACLLWRWQPSRAEEPGPGEVGRRAAVLAGPVFALAAMTRPEGILYTAIGGVMALVEARPAGADHPGAGSPRVTPRARLTVAARFVGGFLLLYLPYTLWRVTYYGHLLPNTFHAKVAGPPSEVLARGWEYLTRIPGEWPVLPVVALAALALPALRRDRLWAWLLGVVLACCASFVLLGGDFLIYFGPRMLMPGLPFALLLAAEGLRRSAAALPWRRVGQSVAVGALVALALHALWRPWPRWGGPLGGIASTQRTLHVIGEWLNRQSPEGAVVATGAAGIVPYVTGWRTVDMYGLVDEHIAHHAEFDPRMPAAHAKSDPVYVLEQRPDYLISDLTPDGRPYNARLGVVADRIAREYELVAQAKAKRGALVRGRRLIETDRFRPDLHRKGYLVGILRRRAEPTE